MKHIVFIVLFAISIQTTHAQFSENHAIYGSGSLDFGNYFGADLNLNYVYQENYSFKIGYSGHIRSPKSKPDDYSTGLFRALTLGIASPYDNLETFHLMAGKIYKFNEKGTIRLNLSVGLALVNIKEPTNWQMNDNGFLDQNYTWDYYEYSTIGIIINPKIEFPFTRHYGLSISPVLQLNKDRVYIGIGIGQMIGLLRKRN
ncbi:hypothetical protein U8527_19065 [Kordia algicida OT-1]|uniref:Outer membrane protein beta-barrel domain-containing protein n=1 Tax=Kordia algicida OT-1 TaxID=391587 RepID=A9DJI1_9FLAO|nr:hypothetical protein [Kordia algicida]EDP98107.1 hypothetical protein KAOT1_12857 [Kordia algicida OT-1]